MKKENKDYNFSFIRTFFCLTILFYHLNILNGGYLAVCSFFVLAGYFATLSLIKNNNLIQYYIKKLKRIYLPLIITLFFTLSIITILKIDILNLKPEVKSILLSYNNYWQIKTKTDYFAKHINSPFIHLWYISILIQIQFVFPIIFILLKKAGDKINKKIPGIILFLIAILSTYYFYHISITKDIMITYYDTLSRLFSFIFGVNLGIINLYYNKYFLMNKKKNISLIIFNFSILILILLFIFIKSSSNLFSIAMILTTIITLILIESGIALYKHNSRYDNKIIKFISNISYEIYLVQYPIIFLFQYLKINKYLKIFLIIVIILLISSLIHISTQKIKKDKFKYFKIFIKIIFIVSTVFGLYQFIIMRDYTKEMQKLKESLTNQEKIIKEKQLEYRKKQLNEKEEWNNYLNSFEIDKDKLYEYVTNLKIVGIGDSIMLDPVNSLYNEFPNGYFDAKVSRSTCASSEVLKNIKNSGITWDILVFNLGTNDYPNDKCKNNLVNLVGNSKVFWLNATHPDYDNSNYELEKYAKKHENIYILDWVSEANKHPEYLYPDKTHLKPNAFKPYAKFIKDEIYKYFLNEKTKEKEKNIMEAIKNKKENITFYGNDLLTNIFDTLQEKYPDSKFIADNKMNRDKLIKKLKEEKEEDLLNKKLFFVFDNQSKIEKKDYEEIIKICENNSIYIISTNNLELNYDNVKIININFHEDDYVYDKIHLTKEANEKLINEIDHYLY